MITLRDFRPAREFALNFGVKSVVFGPPGSGKSPICVNTAPNACAVICEPGFLSLRSSTVLTVDAFQASRIEDFFEWLKNSQEAKQFHTVVIDSVSQMAEILVDSELGGTSKGGNEQHGLRAYGKMSRTMMKYLNQMYFMPQKNIVLIAKQQIIDINGVAYKRPYFPGKELPVRVPHLFDLVMQLDRFTNIPGAAPKEGGHRAFKAAETYDCMGRDRSGNLAAYEPPDLAQIFTKAVR